MSQSTDPLGSPLARAAFDASTECQIILAPDGVVIAVNRAFCDLYGIDAAATVGRHYMGFSADFDIRRFGDPLEHPKWVTASALKGETVRGVLQGVRNRVTGREFFGRYGATPVLEDGRLVATVITVLDVTEATRAAQGFEAALSAAEIGTWRADVVEGTVWPDANFARICGLPETALQGIPLAALYGLIHPDDRERTTRAFREATESRASHEVEYRVVLPDGGVRWLVSRGRAALSDSGEPRERVGSIVDLTRQKESEAILRATTDALPAFVAHMDADLVYRFCNRRFEEWFGRPRSEIVGRPMREIVGEATFERLRPYLERALRGERASYEQWLDFPAGTRFMRATYVPSLAPDGRVEGLSAMIADDTEARLAQEAAGFMTAMGEAVRPLPDPEEILATVSRMLGERLGASRCAYAEVDVDAGTMTIVRDWSPGLSPSVGVYPIAAFGERIPATQLGGETLVLRNVAEEMPGDPGAEALAALRIAAIVCVPLVKRGRLVAMMAVHQAVPRDWREHEVGLVQAVAERCWGSLERARAERALRRANEELERRVEARTEELTRANRDLDEFAYSVAHDLRAPLRAIVSTSRILVEDAGDRLADDERELLERQARNAVRLARIVDDLLSFARLTKATLRKTPFDLSALAREVAEEVRTRRESPCAIRVQEGMRAHGDPSLIGYALTNLLDNACKYSPEGGTVTIGETDGAIFVRDEGVGFDMAHAHKLFVAFERLVGQESFEGSGVGLANVKRIVEKHGGRVWAQSEPGKGATFWFTLG